MRADAARKSAKTESSLSAAGRAATAERAAFRKESGMEARGRLVDALLGLASEAFRVGDDNTVAATLAEVEAALPAELPASMPWGPRAMNVHRAKAGFAQKQGRSADAVAAFTAALAVLPTDSEGARDAYAVRLQLLVRLARSRLALGQASEVAAEAEECEAIMIALGGAIPSRAIDTIRTAVLANAGGALAQLGRPDAAAEKFEASIATIDRLGGGELATLRTQVANGLATALQQSGRASEASALVSGEAHSSHDGHSAACGCGHDHAHSQHHHHDDDHHDHHHSGCGCGAPH